MTDDTDFVRTSIDFAPYSIPHGTLDYDLKVLTSYQQTVLNEFKLNEIRENEKYLAKHPEIRALIVLALRSIFLRRPRTDLYLHIGKFFSQPRSNLETAVQQYLEEREPHVTEGDSAVGLFRKSSESIEMDDKDFHQDVLDKVLEKAFDRLGLNLENDDWDLKQVLDKVTPSESIVQKIIEELMNNAVSEKDRDVLKYLSKLHDDETENVAGGLLGETEEKGM